MVWWMVHMSSDQWTICTSLITQSVVSQWCWFGFRWLEKTAVSWDTGGDFLPLTNCIQMNRIIVKLSLSTSGRRLRGNTQSVRVIKRESIKRLKWFITWRSTWSHQRPETSSSVSTFSLLPNMDVWKPIIGLVCLSVCRVCGNISSWSNQIKSCLDRVEKVPRHKQII